MSVAIAGKTISVIAKPGLPYWNTVSPAVHLLAEEASPGEKTLLIGCGRGELAALFTPRTRLWLADNNHLALQTTRLTLQENNLPPVEIIQLPLPTAEFDTVAMTLPKGRKLARRWLVEAHAALADGGALYLAGANDEGIQSVLADADSLFGNSGILGYKKGNRIARMRKLAHERSLPPWASEPGIARGSWYEWELTVLGKTYALRTLPGVFSYDQLDEGTALLLEHLQVPAGASVLDFGCGYGIIGMAAAQMGAASVDLVDADLFAIASAQENLARNGIPNGRVLPSDVLSAVSDQKYQLVVSNPPFHSGKSVEYTMTETFITHAYHLLEAGGQMMLVANRFIRYDRLLQSVFGQAEVVAQTGKFHVLRASKLPWSQTN